MQMQMADTNGFLLKQTIAICTYVIIITHRKQVAFAPLH